MLNDINHEAASEVTEHPAQQAVELNRLIHEPARLAIMAVLDAADEVDFKFLLAVTSLTKGNLSRQTARLEEAGYIQIRKYHKGKIPATSYRITATGQSAFAAYREQIQQLLHPPVQRIELERDTESKKEQ